MPSECELDQRVFTPGRGVITPRWVSVFYSFGYRLEVSV